MSKSPSLRRIQADIRELAFDPSDQYTASPLESDMFEWHFTIRGAKGTDFEGGLYHGRILLPPDYPFKPPHIMFLNPSGRFETNTKVCLSFSAYHPELWQPAWGIRLILEALISFLPTPADGAIGALDWSSKERKRLAKKSVDFCCPTCGRIAALIPVEKKQCSEASATDAASAPPSRFAKEIMELQRLQMQEHQKTDEDDEDAGQKSAAEEESKSESDQLVESPEAEESGEEKEPESPEEERASSSEEAGESKSEEETLKDEVTEQDDEPDKDVSVGDGNAATTPTVAAPTADVAVAARGAQQQQQQPVSSGVWWFVDPLLQLIIIILSAICFLLLRKVQALCADLQALDV